MSYPNAKIAAGRYGYGLYVEIDGELVPVIHGGAGETEGAEGGEGGEGGVASGGEGGEETGKGGEGAAAAETGEGAADGAAGGGEASTAAAPDLKALFAENKTEILTAVKDLIREELRAASPSGKEPSGKQVEDALEGFRFDERTPVGKMLNRIIDKQSSLEKEILDRESRDVSTYIATQFESNIDRLLDESKITSKHLRSIYKAKISEINPPSADRDGRVSERSIAENTRAAFAQAQKEITEFVKEHEAEIVSRLKKSPTAGPPVHGAGGAKPREPEKTPVTYKQANRNFQDKMAKIFGRG